MFPPSSPPMQERAASLRPVAIVKQIYLAFTNGRSLIGCLLNIAYGAAPAFLWVFSFKHAGAIPTEWRPKINTELLPRLDAVLTSFIGTVLLTIIILPAVYHLLLSSTKSDQSWSINLSNKRVLASYTLLLYPTVLSILSWLGTTSISNWKDMFAFGSYGALHFASPFLGAFMLWLWAPAGVAATFGWSLGFQNCLSLLTHLLFPNAPPWFADTYGSPPIPAASYETLGNPAGLIRVDDIMGWTLYHKAFKKSPVVFGAIPSVHAGTAVCVALYMCRYYNNIGSALVLAYAAWMLWSTMYLRHHYAIDLIAGSCYALAFFLLFRHTSLKRMDGQALERGSTNGWQRLVQGYGSRFPSVLPSTSNNSSYAELSTHDIDEGIRDLEK